MWLTCKIISDFIDGRASTSHASVHCERVILIFFSNLGKEKRTPDIGCSVFAQTKICVRGGNQIAMTVDFAKPVFIPNTALRNMFQHVFCHTLYNPKPATHEAVKTHFRDSCVVIEVL